MYIKHYRSVFVRFFVSARGEAKLRDCVSVGSFGLARLFLLPLRD